MNLLATLLLAIGTVAASSTPASLAAAHTNVVKYAASSMTVTGRLTGSCWTSSIASDRSDAFRCMAGNAIHDPCFVLTKTSVACPQNAFTGRGVVMTLDKPLPPAASPPAHPQAWAMLLQSGAQCARGTGTILPGYPFYCSGKLGVCGQPDLAKARPAYFVTCASTAGGKPEHASSTLVKTIYE
jgi:hypothetical protein